MPKQNAFAGELRAPALGLLITEPLRALLEACAAGVAAAAKPTGDGHPVVVYPGLGAGALTTVRLRHALRDAGYTPYDWGGGINRGPQGDADEWLATLAQRVCELHAQHGMQASLVGWSLGGIYAREIAKLCPQAVRQVITLGTPFAAMRDANHAGTIFRLLGGDTSQLTPEFEARLRQSPPVRSTSIYSRSDGVVCWRGCLQPRGPLARNVEVHASHLGMGTHPQVLRVILAALNPSTARRR